MVNFLRFIKLPPLVDLVAASKTALLTACNQLTRLAQPNAIGGVPLHPLRVVNKEDWRRFPLQLAYHKDVRKITRTLPLLIFCSTILGRDYGPPIGNKLPGFVLQDQDGKSQTLENLLGPKGAVILFYRSADW